MGVRLIYGSHSSLHPAKGPDKSAWCHGVIRASFERRKQEQDSGLDGSVKYFAGLQPSKEETKYHRMRERLLKGHHLTTPPAPQRSFR